MPPTLSLVLNQIVASLAILQRRAARAGVVTMFAITIIAIATAPDSEPGFWSWVGLLLIAILSTLAVLAYVASRNPLISPENRQYRLTGSVTLGVIALVVNLVFSFSSTVLLLIGLILLGRQAGRVRPGVVPWMLCAALITFVPWWIWAALGVWNPGLIVLIPLTGLAWLSAGHIRAAYRPRSEEESAPLSLRGHRLGAWMGMLLGGILIVLAGLLGHASNAWIALGGVLMAIAVAMEAGISRPEDNPGKYSAAICDGAFVALAICWLIGLS
ncbi:MAG TPA: hypothetical protein VNZ55_14010 [Thermomicrobiales bacterium]|nr:hypothetical protein [Thermomicrobiales bacterium]